MPVDLDRIEFLSTHPECFGYDDLAMLREAVAELRELRAAVPRWTKEKPTVPGWYWAWHPTPWDAPAFPPQIVEIRRGTLPDKFVVQGHMVAWPPAGWEWCGPLAPPSDPEPRS